MLVRPAGDCADGHGIPEAIHSLKPHLVRSTSDSCRAGAIERHSA
jgi:hypothetical protein